jgi:DegV family protein with EDD domain
VVAISLTARLSGTHQAALAAAGRVSRPGQLTVLDSRNVSVGMGLVVLAAAEHARAGKAVAEVLAAAEHAAANTRTYGAIPDLSYAVRGGRIPQPWRSLAGILPLGFLLATDDQGGVQVRGVLRRGGNRVQALLGIAARDRAKAGNSSRLRVAIAHSNSPELGEQLRAACAARLTGVESIHVTDLGPAYGAHGGPGTLALAVQEYLPP